MKPKTVAIVGYSDVNLKYLKHSQVEEIWTMNHHWFLQEQLPEDKRDVPRVDRLFELHWPEWFTRKEVPRAVEYRAWLKKEHTFPIYMLQQMDEFPNCVVYPREEVKRDVFANLWRGDQNEIEYYTSSVGLMIAFAIHLGVERIELYGVEMATDTEYADQKPAGEFMLGLAAGRGIDVVLHPTCTLCNAQVYGYEGVPHILHDRLDALVGHYEQLQRAAEMEAERVTALFNTGREKDHDKALAAIDTKAMYYGAVAVLKTLQKEHDAYVSAQFLEQKMGMYQNEEENWKGLTNMAKAEAELLIKQKARQEAETKWKDYLDKRATMMAHSGATQVIKKLRQECRLMKPEHTLSRMIVE